MNQNDAYSLTNDNFAWRTSFIGVLTILIALPIIRPTMLPTYKFLAQGLPTTIIVTVFGIILASIIGFLVGIGRVWNNFLNKILSIYVEVIRGIPLLMQIIYIYFVFGRLLQLDRITASIVALSICYGAYMAEIVRSGLMSIPNGQVEAAKALGMNKAQVFRYVVIPQAIRIVLPPYGNEFIAMLKDSSLISVIAVSDIMLKARQYTSIHFNYFEVFSIAAMFYLFLTLCFSKLVNVLEKLLAPRGNSRHKPTEEQKNE